MLDLWESTHNFFLAVPMQTVCGCLVIIGNDERNHANKHVSAISWLMCCYIAGSNRSTLLSLPADSSCSALADCAEQSIWLCAALYVNNLQVMIGVFFKRNQTTHPVYRGILLLQVLVVSEGKSVIVKIVLLCNSWFCYGWLYEVTFTLRFFFFFYYVTSPEIHYFLLKKNTLSTHFSVALKFLLIITPVVDLFWSKGMFFFINNAI